MNATTFRILFDYNAWANAQVMKLAKNLTPEQFTHDSGYSLGSVRDQLIHMASVDARWLARVRHAKVPLHFKPEDFPTIDKVGLLWSVVYDEIGHYIDNLHDDILPYEAKYTARDAERLTPVWQILLHVLNHSTDHRAQILYLMHQMNVITPPQDFIFYLRDEMPPRGVVKVDAKMMRFLFDYDAYATSRMVSESLAELTDEQLDHDFNYSHKTLRGQLAHVMMAGQYWLERAFETQIDGSLSAILSKGSQLLADMPDEELMKPIEYTTGNNEQTANIRWEMLWQLINHGTDHRAQMLYKLHQLDAPTFEQDIMVYLWEREDVMKDEADLDDA